MIQTGSQNGSGDERWKVVKKDVQRVKNENKEYWLSVQLRSQPRITLPDTEVTEWRGKNTTPNLLPFRKLGSHFCSAICHSWTQNWESKCLRWTPALISVFCPKTRGHQRAGPGSHSVAVQAQLCLSTAQRPNHSAIWIYVQNQIRVCFLNLNQEGINSGDPVVTLCSYSTSHLPARPSDFQISTSSTFWMDRYFGWDFTPPSDFTLNPTTHLWGSMKHTLWMKLTIQQTHILFFFPKKKKKRKGKTILLRKLCWPHIKYHTHRLGWSHRWNELCFLPESFRWQHHLIS